MTDRLPPSNLTILDRVGYTYFETDLTGIITSVNDALCKALGYTREELVGQPFSAIATSGHEAVFETVYKTRQSQMDLEYSLRRKDDTFIYAEGGISIKVDGQAQAIGFRGVLHDITPHKKVEASLQQAKEKFERELEIGRQIQTSFLPAELPQVRGWDIASLFQAARHVSGDFYDAFSLADGRFLGVVLADVCDKGVGAALFMALIRSLLRAYTGQFYSLEWVEVLAGRLNSPEILESLKTQVTSLPGAAQALRSAVNLTNKYLIDNHGDTSMFATLFFGVFEADSGSCMYINAGHEPPFILGKKGIIQRLNPTGPAVGLIPDFDFPVEEITLKPGEMILTYTDGVVDALSPSGLPFNIHRLESLLEKHSPNASTRIESIKSGLQTHISGADQYDDITLVAVRRAG